MADPIVHETIIKAKMTQLANVTVQAQDRINSQILSNGARDMLENLDADAYQEYINELNLFDVVTYAAFDALSFDALTSAQKALRNLIYAESYFSLYYLALSLKKLVKGAVNTTRDAAGGASLVAAPFDDIIANADNYRDLANQCLGFATAGSTDEPDDIYSQGQFGVFTV
jgi:hypothetical protein